MTHTAATLKRDYALVGFRKTKNLLGLKATGWQGLADKLNEREELEAAQVAKGLEEQAQQEKEADLEAQFNKAAVEKINEIGDKVQLTVESWKRLQDAVLLNSGYVTLPLETTGVYKTIVYTVSFDYYGVNGLELVLSAIQDEIEKQEYRDSQDDIYDSQDELIKEGPTKNIKTIKFQSGQVYQSSIGPVKVIRDKRSTFVWLYQGQKRLQGGLVEVIGGQEVLTLKDGSTLLAGDSVEEVYCINPSVLPINQSFKAIVTELHYVINGIAYPQNLFLAF